MKQSASSTRAVVASLQPASRSFPCTDLGNAKRFVNRYRDVFRFDHRRKVWLMWNGHWWTIVDDSQVFRAVVEMIEDVERYAKQKNDEKLCTWMATSASGNHMNDVLYRSRNLEPFAIEHSEWDANPYLFAVANGVVDLRTGQFREGQQSDLITLHSPIIYDATANCSTFDKFFDEIFLSREDLKRYALKALGYSLTGDVRERCLFIMWGSGNNGKSLLSNLIGYIMGDYGKSTPSETLSSTREDGPRNDIARLVGTRYVTASETGLRKGVAEELLKRITGKDKLTARFLNKEFFDFVPQFKFWLSCNHKPPIQGIDNAIWSRIPLIPFDGEFRGTKDDKELDSKLQAEAPGILNRLIEGCLLWQQEGLKLPDCIQAASADYRSESNPIAPFLDTCCECDQAQDADWGSDWAISKHDLFSLYTKYCGRMRIKPDIKNTFGGNLIAAGFKDGKNNKVRWWKGIRKIQESDDASDFEPDVSIE